MKEFIKPEIIVKSFSDENILTDSTTAVQQAVAVAANIADTEKTFTVVW